MIDCRACCLLLAGACALPQAAWGNRYTIVDLGKQLIAYQVNREGVIAGGTGMTDKAILYRHGKWHYLDDRQQEGTANALDARGDAVGFNGNEAVMWERFGVLTPLPLPSAASFSVAFAVAGDRSSVGYYIPADGLAHCFLSRPGGSAEDLGTLGEGDACFANAINGRGQVVGATNRRPGGSQRAFLWENGSMRSLGVLGQGDYSTALSINERGHVVGASTRTVGSRLTHAFAWSGGAMRDLDPADSFPLSEATAISDDGEIVGDAGDSPTATPHAVRFDQGDVIELDAELENREDWKLAYAFGINDSGVIVGQGQRQDGTHGFMLVPAAAPGGR